MSYTTPKYGLVVPSPATRLNQLGTQLQQMGISIEEVLESFDYNGADPNLVLSRVAALEAWRASAQAKIDAFETATMDTGWVDCTLRPGITQQGGRPPQVRSIGNFVKMRWGVSGTGLSASAARDVADLPAGFAPSEYGYFQGAADQAAKTFQFTVTDAGVINIRTNSTVPTYALFDTASWLRG